MILSREVHHEPFSKHLLGGVAVAIVVHLIATWLYHRGVGVILSPISAAFRASAERAREKRDREVASLRNSKDDLILATIREVLSILHFFGMAGAGLVFLLFAALLEFLTKHFPSVLVGMTPNPITLQWMTVVAGLLCWFLAFLELFRSSNAREVLMAATRPPAARAEE